MASTEEISEKIDNDNVQPLNIQLLDQSKMHKCILLYVETLKDDRKSSVEEKIKDLSLTGQFIEVYNEKQKDKAEKKFAKEENEENKHYFIYKYKNNRKNEDIDFAETYSCTKKYVTKIEKSESSTAINREETITSDFIIFFVLKNENREVTSIFAATTGHAWQVARSCNDMTFPIKIIKSIGCVEKIKKIERRSLFEDATKETLFHPRHINLYQTSSLYYLVENVRCEMNQESGEEFLNLLGRRNTTDLSNKILIDDEDEQTNNSILPPTKKRKTDEEMYPDLTITTAGSVLIEEKYEVQDYFCVLKFLERNFFKLQPINNNFEFLHFFETPEEKKSILDDKLIEDIFDRFQNDKEQYVTVRHKCFEDFLLSKKFEIQITKRKHFKSIGSIAPDIYTIIDEVRESGTDLENFKVKMKNGKLRFSYKYDTFVGPIIDYIEGEIFYNEQHYFKMRSTWYQMDVDYLSLLQQDFEKVMGETFVEEGEEGCLPLSWKKDVALHQAELQKLLNYSQLEMIDLMNKLKGMKVSYILNDKVMQEELVGEILKVTKIKNYKSEIEFALQNCLSFSKSNWLNLLQKRINESHEDKNKKVKIHQNDLEDIWLELNKVRPVLTGVKESSTTVKNPFPYLLDIGQKYDIVKKFLIDSYIFQKEEDYNRSYLYIPKSLNLKGHKYVVFDQVLPDGIEPCDILSYTNDSVYLYHVKEEFGHSTRDVCSQMFNSATRIQEALRTNQNDHYLKRLWHEAVGYNKNEEWRLKLKIRLLTDFNEETFLDLFRQRDIVFVYAYRTPCGFKKSSTRKQISDSIKNASKNLGFVDKYGALTNKFFSVRKTTFQRKLLDHDKTLDEEECNEAYDTMTFDCINYMCKDYGYINKFGALTTKFLCTSNKDDFAQDMQSKNGNITKIMYERFYATLKQRVFSKSSLAKMEVVRVAEKLRLFQSRFKLKICQIPVHDQI